MPLETSGASVKPKSFKSSRCGKQRKDEIQESDGSLDIGWVPEKLLREAKTDTLEKKNPWKSLKILGQPEIQAGNTLVLQQSALQDHDKYVKMCLWTFIHFSFIVNFAVTVSFTKAIYSNSCSNLTLEITNSILFWVCSLIRNIFR